MGAMASGAFSVPPEFEPRITEALDPLANPAHDPTKYLGKIDAVLRAIAHPVRRAMLSTLSDGGEMSATQLGKAIGLQDGRLQDALYQVRYLKKSGCIEQTGTRPPKKGNTLVRLYRVRHDYVPVLAAIADLEQRLKLAPAPVAPAPTITRVPLKSGETCSCENPVADGDGYCFNCTKPVAARAA
jgi:DNA-binding transcriptional ArsR family regulator